MNYILRLQKPQGLKETLFEVSNIRRELKALEKSSSNLFQFLNHLS
jgi:hypothetical protein